MLLNFASHVPIKAPKIIKRGPALLWLRRAFLLALSIQVLPTQALATDCQLIVFAAASLTDVMPEHGKRWSAETGCPIPRFSFAASAINARQIAAGAPADLFISSNMDWLAYLNAKNLLETAPVTLVDNQLIYIAPVQSPLQTAKMPSPELFLSMVGKKKLAIADPSVSPAGQYSVQFLKKLGVWDQIQNQIAYSANVRQALFFIEHGDMTGFVYHSDVQQNSNVQAVFTVPLEMSGRIEYAAAPIKGSNAKTQNFLTYLQSSQALPLWLNAGFLSHAPK